MFNVPNPDGTFNQHVQNNSNEAWCRFVGMNGYCWGLFDDGLYFGADNGKIYQADTGSLDGGVSISGTAQQAWNDFQDPQRKNVKAMRCIIGAAGVVSYTVGIGFDYDLISAISQWMTQNEGSPWDISPWDVSPWSSPQIIDTRWKVGAGSGVAIGISLTVSAPQQVVWLRTDFRFESGIGL